MQNAIAKQVVVENGPYKGRQGAFTRDCVWIHGQHLAKTDLVRVIRTSDRYEAKILEANPTMLTITAMHLGASQERSLGNLAGDSELSEWYVTLFNFYGLALVIALLCFDL